MIFKFTAQSRDKAEEILEEVINKEDDNDIIESLKEVLNLLQGVPDDKTLAQVISAAIAEAIGEGGAIETWADARYTKQTVETPGSGTE